MQSGRQNTQKKAGEKFWRGSPSGVLNGIFGYLTIMGMQHLQTALAKTVGERLFSRYWSWATKLKSHFPSYYKRYNHPGSQVLRENTARQAYELAKQDAYLGMTARQISLFDAVKHNDVEALKGMVFSIRDLYGHVGDASAVVRTVELRERPRQTLLALILSEGSPELKKYVFSQIISEYKKNEGANKNGPGNRTLLHWHAMFGQLRSRYTGLLAATPLLLDKVDLRGNTPFLAAARYQQLSALKLIHGIKMSRIKSLNAHGQVSAAKRELDRLCTDHASALRIAATRKLPDVFNTCARALSVLQVMTGRATWCKSRAGRFSALNAAITHSNAQQVKQLLALGAPADSAAVGLASVRCKTLVALALHTRLPNIALELVKHGARAEILVNARFNHPFDYLKTDLCVAIKRNLVPVVRALALSVAPERLSQQLTPVQRRLLVNYMLGSIYTAVNVSSKLLKPLIKAAKVENKKLVYLACGGSPAAFSFLPKVVESLIAQVQISNNELLSAASMAIMSNNDAAGARILNQIKKLSSQDTGMVRSMLDRMVERTCKQSFASLAAKVKFSVEIGILSKIAKTGDVAWVDQALTLYSGCKREPALTRTLHEVLRSSLTADIKRELADKMIVEGANLTRQFFGKTYALDLALKHRFRFDDAVAALLLTKTSQKSVSVASQVCQRRLDEAAKAGQLEVTRFLLSDRCIHLQTRGGAPRLRELASAINKSAGKRKKDNYKSIMASLKQAADLLSGGAENSPPSVMGVSVLNQAAQSEGASAPLKRLRR
jgi:hypothetical protein